MGTSSKKLNELPRRFVDGPVLVIPGGGRGSSDSRGAVVIPGSGTVYFGAYRSSGDWGTLEGRQGCPGRERRRLVSCVGACAAR
jgi:hypothetical protein